MQTRRNYRYTTKIKGYVYLTENMTVLISNEVLNDKTIQLLVYIIRT